MTIDLRGLGTALKTHAQSKGLTVSEAARLALVQMLASPGAGTPVEGGRESVGSRGRIAKLTVRMSADIAQTLTERARVAGLSRGAYLSTIIAQTPAPPLATAASLVQSTARLASVSADLNAVMRLARRAPASSGTLLDNSLRPVLRELHQHLAVASQLMREIRPARAQLIRPCPSSGAGAPQ